MKFWLPSTRALVRCLSAWRFLWHKKLQEVEIVKFHTKGIILLKKSQIIHLIIAEVLVFFILLWEVRQHYNYDSHNFCRHRHSFFGLQNI